MMNLEALKALAAKVEAGTDWPSLYGGSPDSQNHYKAINEYDAWMLDDDYEAAPILHKIMSRIKARAALEGKG